MARRAKSEGQKMLRAVVVLLRNTTWKCGKVERLVIQYLQSHLLKYGSPRSSVMEMAQYFNLNGKQKSEFFDALRRLEKRHIIEIRRL
ncbi:MAG: hypothetical protein QW804_00500 [Candidatus Bathyarchaeia archaeon]|nr:hypothetical protein [Candidatus Bathyarchaeota archaeon]